MGKNNLKATCYKEEVKSEVLRIADKLRGFKLKDCCKLINDYLKETVEALDITDQKTSHSTAYDALIEKKSNSYGYISAFEEILKELGINEHIYTKKEGCFRYRGNLYVFEFLRVEYIEGNSENEYTLIFSPYTEKFCNQNFINHDIWLSTLTRLI